MPCLQDDNSVALLRTPGSEHVWVRRGAAARDVIALFRRYPGLRLLPVLDETHRPVGAIYEEDVRNILFNPFGHALLNNPGIDLAFGERAQRCPVAEIDLGIAGLLAIHARSGGKEAVIVTREGRYAGVIPNHALIAAADAQELARLRLREAELERLRDSSASFERDIQHLSGALGAIARTLQLNATGTAGRSQDNDEHALQVLAAAGQTGAMMDDIARSSAALVASLGGLDQEAGQAHAVAMEAVDRVAANAAQIQALHQATESIETITASIETLARTVNLLSLNASIEAARAGESGRGFAVVANEVRELASRTGEAAHGIKAHALTVRATVDHVLAAQTGLERVIASVKQIAEGVTDSVSAQRALSLQLASGTAQAVAASKEIEARIAQISGNAATATASAQDLARTAHDVEGSSATLSHRVGRFLEDIAGYSAAA